MADKATWEFINTFAPWFVALGTTLIAFLTYYIIKRYFKRGYDLDNSFWNTRTQAIKEIDGKFRHIASIIHKVFELMDEMIIIFENNSTGDDYYKACGISLLKAKNYCHCMYSLSLDGNSQEAGAVLRPAIECGELLTYFREDPNRHQEAWDDRLPSAGNIAQRIRGQYRELRSDLNESASHFSFKQSSIKHLFSVDGKKWIINQSYIKKNLRINLALVWVLMFPIAINAAEALYAINPDLLPKSIATDLENMKSQKIEKMIRSYLKDYGLR